MFWRFQFLSKFRNIFYAAANKDLSASQTVYRCIHNALIDVFSYIKIRLSRSVYLASNYVTILCQTDVDVTDGVIETLLIVKILGRRPSLLNLIENIKL